MSKRKRFILLLVAYIAFIAIAAFLFSLPEKNPAGPFAGVGDFINFLIVMAAMNLLFFLLVEFYFFPRGLLPVMLLPLLNFLLGIFIIYPLLQQFRFLAVLDAAADNYFLVSLAYVAATIILLRLFYPWQETVKDYE